MEWNARCEVYAHLRGRLEDAPASFGAIAELVGSDPSAVRMPERVKTMSRMKERFGRGATVVSHAELRRAPDYSGLVAIAERYGYDLEDPPRLGC